MSQTPRKFEDEQSGGGVMKSIDSLPKQLPLCLFDREIVRQGQVHWQWRQRKNTPQQQKPLKNDGLEDYYPFVGW